MEKPVVAIDIGGSKTDILYYKDSEPVFKRLEIGAKHKDLSTRLFNERIKRIRDEVKDFQGRYVFSIAGLDSREDIDYWNRVIKKYFKSTFIMVHDVKASLYAATIGGDGVIVISGTGCNVYGEYKGRSAYSGDWGWRLGDDFSGYRLGRDFLNYILRMYDGRMRRRRVFYNFLDFTGLEESSLINYLNSLNVDSIASLTRFICSYSYEDDYIRRMIKRLIKEALRAIKAVVKKLNYIKPVIHRAGGMFRCEFFNELFLSEIFDMGYFNGEYIEYPVIGSLLIALMERGYSKQELKKIKRYTYKYISGILSK